MNKYCDIIKSLLLAEYKNILCISLRLKSR